MRFLRTPGVGMFCPASRGRMGAKWAIPPPSAPKGCQRYVTGMPIGGIYRRGAFRWGQRTLPVASRQILREA
jgi:hypothetical protein